MKCKLLIGLLVVLTVGGVMPFTALAQSRFRSQNGIPVYGHAAVFPGLLSGGVALPSVPMPAPSPSPAAVPSSVAAGVPAPTPAASPAVTVYGWGSVESVAVDKREEGLDIKGHVPRLAASLPEISMVNERVAAVAKARETAAKEAKAQSIAFDYKLYTSEGMVSLVLFSTVTAATTRVEVDSVNFSPESGALHTLQTAMGLNIKPLADKLLSDRIRQTPEMYNTAFTGLTEAQAFYLTDTSLVLLFGEFQLTSAAKGVESVAIQLDHIKQAVVYKGTYSEISGYLVKMVPLRRVCEPLGYAVQWDQTGRRISISHRGQPFLELTIDNNNYLLPDQKVRTLEVAPVMFGDVTYVPISFFDQVLGPITYSVDADGHITFLAYSAD